MFARFFRTDAHPTGFETLLLSSLLFGLLIAAYVVGSHFRALDNPQDKVMPSVTKLIAGVKLVALEKDRDGEIRLWVDTAASARRFAIAIAIVFSSIFLGVTMGVFPYVNALLYRFLVFFDKIPALSLLPILFIIFGLGELSKIALIVIGVLPTVCLDACLKAKALPSEQIDKAHTLGASEFEIAYRVVFPQVFPRMLDTIRLNFKSAMLLLIAGESLAATVGLGYRIFVVRRYVAMDIIIPYVIWMTVLLFLADIAVQHWIRSYRWLDKD
jgi:NitT/TauT family transport system permease protein